MKRIACFTLVALVTILAGTSSAQVLFPRPLMPPPPQPRPAPSPSALESQPNAEIGLSAGGWKLDDNSFLLGVHFSADQSSWLAYEGSLERGIAGGSDSPYGMFVLNARFSATVDDHHTPQFFATVGGAAAAGLSYGFSPMVGVGVQTPSRGHRGVVRVEFQYLPAGQAGRDNVRLMVGFSVLVR